jgi:hypothetical protein
MKVKTYLFEFLVYPNDQEKQRAIYIKAQGEGDSPLDDEKMRDEVRAVAAKHIPEMNPTNANPGNLIATSEEEPPVEYFRHKDHPGVIAWESNRGVKSVA